MPPSGGGGIGSTESFVLKRVRVLVKIPAPADLLGLLDKTSANGGVANSSPYSSSRKVEAGDGSRQLWLPFGAVFSSIALFRITAERWKLLGILDL